MTPNTERGTTAAEEAVWVRVPPAPAAPGEEYVEATWSGRKLWLRRAQLDAWYHGSSFEDRVDYVRTHPGTVQIPVHRFAPPAGAAPAGEEDALDPDDYVLVRWSGKDLLLERAVLDRWYDMPYEAHDAYVRAHPDHLLDDGAGA